MDPVIAALIAGLFAIGLQLDVLTSASFSVSGTLLVVLPMIAFVYVLLIQKQIHRLWR
jgi:hypothetical protein